MIFTQKVIMKCDQYNYLEFLRDNLIDLGYSESEDIEYHDMQFITNNYKGCNGVFGAPIRTDPSLDRIIIEEFNPKLFLALSAMSNVMSGIYNIGINGEYYRCISQNDAICEYDEIVKLINVSEDRMTATLEKINRYQFNASGLYLSRNFIKAEAHELIKIFDNRTFEKIQIGNIVNIDTKIKFITQ